ncbi:hypothetical protein BGAL_0051g00180 [Botrytis galanthina]|uniref:6-methylsalicylate decarboxylase n=1 Tax=Botrytis galanthina TaxID=278940 RepID=A0A4S8R873_9HELO|nr:hypothetical protein BGAL_0051g00180 [Botrytis galanthina]
MHHNCCSYFYNIMHSILQEDVSSFLRYHGKQFRLRHITPRSHITCALPDTRPVGTIEKIDTHHHMIPPVYLDHIKENSKEPSDLIFPTWSPQISLDFMARNSISTSILSFAHAALGDSSLCQDINIYAHNLRLQYPTKFGFFATIPIITVASLPEVLASIKFCYEKLNPEGFTLLTSYDGKYLGHEIFRPIWEELNRISAVVFIHPIANSLSPQSPDNNSLIPPIIDFTHEMTRTACSLIYANTLSTYPKLKIILSHAGGALPYVSSSVANLTFDACRSAQKPEQFMREARSFYTDLAASSYGGSVGYVERWLGLERTTYGSDFPFPIESTMIKESEFLDSWIQKNGAEGKAALRKTALELFPRLKAQIEQAQIIEEKSTIENLNAGSGQSDIAFSNAV